MVSDVNKITPASVSNCLPMKNSFCDNKGNILILFK